MMRKPFPAVLVGCSPVGLYAYGFMPLAQFTLANASRALAADSGLGMTQMRILLFAAPAIGV